MLKEVSNVRDVLFSFYFYYKKDLTKMAFIKRRQRVSIIKER